LSKTVIFNLLITVHYFPIRSVYYVGEKPSLNRISLGRYCLFLHESLRSSYNYVLIKIFVMLYILKKRLGEMLWDSRSKLLPQTNG